MVDVFKENLIDERIQFAFIFGSLAKGTENSESDIDLFVIGNLGLRDLSKLIKNPANLLKREVNPHVMSISEFQKRIIEKEHFVSNVIKSPKLMIFGNENDFTKLG